VTALVIFAAGDQRNKQEHGKGPTYCPANDPVIGMG